MGGDGGVTFESANADSRNHAGGLLSQNLLLAEGEKSDPTLSDHE